MILFLKTSLLKTSLLNRKSWGVEIVREFSPPSICYMSHIMHHMMRQHCLVSELFLGKSWIIHWLPFPSLQWNIYSKKMFCNADLSEIFFSIVIVKMYSLINLVCHKSTLIYGRMGSHWLTYYEFEYDWLSVPL